MLIALFSCSNDLRSFSTLNVLHGSEVQPTSCSRFFRFLLILRTSFFKSTKATSLSYKFSQVRLEPMTPKTILVS